MKKRIITIENEDKLKMKEKSLRFGVIITFLISMVLVMGNNTFADHGVSIDGKLKYSSDFTYFDYTSKAAKKGGDLVLQEPLHGQAGCSWPPE